ncbi:MAG: glycosyltransferase family 39 protein [Sphingobacteriaceae bacterium]|nr:glycosyltransferase family 39 protein [Sphingobacteriaceae bacterium]
MKDTLLDFGQIKHEAEWDSNPPFYHYCLWIWAKLFGVSEFALRSFSALLCSVTLLISALFIRKNFSKKSSFAFIILFSSHPIIFYYSQEARSYCLILLLACLTLISFKNSLDSPTIKKALVLGLLNFLLIYTHYITFYIPLLQAIIVILFERSVLKWFPISALFSLVSFLRFTKGQFQLILGTSPNATSRAWLKKAEFTDLTDFITKMYFHYFFYILLVGYLCFIIYRYWNAITSKKRLIQFLWLLSIAVPIIHFIIALFIPIFVDRYILYSIMFSLIFLSISTTYLNSGYVLVILISVFGSCNLKITYKKDFDF